MSRHFLVPDCQVKPGDDTTHLDWAARAIVEYKPDVVVVIGDFGDFPSLSQHDTPGSKEANGRNVLSDIEAFNEAFERLVAPMQSEQLRLIRNKDKQWNPRCEFLFGNHEDRITRAISREPKYDGLLTLDALKTPGFKRHPYLKIVEIDGIAYCHFFPHPYSGKAIGGTIVNRLNSIGRTFTQGHQQGFLYASKQYPDHVKHGLVCGRFYGRHESYRTEDVQLSEWNGCVVKNECRSHNGQGTYDLMPLSYNYLRSKFG